MKYEKNPDQREVFGKDIKKITELGSGKVLTGIAKRMIKDATYESFENPEDFDIFL